MRGMWPLDWRDQGGAFGNPAHWIVVSNSEWSLD